MMEFLFFSMTPAGRLGNLLLVLVSKDPLLFFIRGTANLPGDRDFPRCLPPTDNEGELVRTCSFSSAAIKKELFLACRPGKKP